MGRVDGPRMGFASLYPSYEFVALMPALGGRVGVEQAVQMDDEIPHLRVVDGLLRLAPPGRIGGGVVRVDADDIELVEILEFGRFEAVELAAEHEMKQLL